MPKLTSEKFNILLIILIFVIPLIALDCSLYFIYDINYEFAKKEQEKKAVHAAETLAIEGDFSYEFATHFREFFDSFQSVSESTNINNSFLINHLDISAKKYFEKPFPQYNLYVFKAPYESNQTELIYFKGSISGGKRMLCKAFEHLFNVDNDIIDNNNKAFAKKLLGDYTDINVIAKDKRGVATHTGGMHNKSWFIWDYVKTKKNGTLGVFLLCNGRENFDKIGRLLALKRLKDRGESVGAFIPIHKDLDEADVQEPLNNSRIFKKWIDTLTAKNAEELEVSFKNSLPQGVELGNYSAYSYLDRGASHIAVVLFKSLERIIFPKWLVVLNILLLYILFVIVYCGLCFGSWIQFSLKRRFSISYILASFIPLCFLCVVSYLYLLEYEKTSIEKAYNKLQMSLNAIESNKQSILKEYKNAFAKSLNDEQLIELIKKNKGIEKPEVTDRVVEIFEKLDENNQLPILGVKIFDEVGNGAFSKGTASTSINVVKMIDYFGPVHVELLRDKIIKDNKNYTLKDYSEEDSLNLIYRSIEGRSLKDDLKNFYSIPVLRRNGDYCSYHIFDTIKVDGETKYLLLVVWDDKTLDGKIIRDAFDNYASIKPEQNFIAYNIKGQKIDPVEGKNRLHASKDLIDLTKSYAKQSFYFKKVVSYEDKENIIVTLPSMNFGQMVLVGYINKIDIKLELFFRTLVFVSLALISFLTLWICSLRSASVFLKPITSLKNALDEVSLNNFNIVLDYESNDEFGKLSSEFTGMIEGLREKERLSKLISDQAVQALKKSSTNALNDTETFKGVALVSDIRNFTGMSEKYDPSLITDLLNEHFAEMAKIISDNGGHIYKFIGDAIEAVFPENVDYEESAHVRAFKAGSMMITKLAIINSRRKKKDFFTYRIGVGLCSGIMFSGTVGSIETRLDYSILGDPLKNAAKYEALSIQNPDFPIVVDEDIAEKMATFGLGFRKLDSKNLNVNVYTFNEIKNQDCTSILGENNQSDTVDKGEKIEDNKIFTITDSKTEKRKKNIWFYFFLILFLSILITSGINLIYYTNFTNLKSESDKLSIRLIEQISCDEALKTCFETLCLDFYEDINKSLNAVDSSKPNKQRIEEISNKYDKLGYPIPKFCCYFFNNKNIVSEDRFFSKGFDRYVSGFISNFAISYYIKNKKDYEEEIYDYLNKLMGESVNIKSLEISVKTMSKRSCLAKVAHEDMLINTDIINDLKNNKKAYIFCGMPLNLDKNLLINYYTLLADKEIILAIYNNNKNSWYFSRSFPGDEKIIIQNSSNKNLLNEKGYFENTINKDGEILTIYSISKDLYSSYFSRNKRIFYPFIISIVLLSFFFWILEKLGHSVAARLRKDMFIASIIPILTVCIVSYLYVKEESDVKKAELIFKLNELINEVENKELFYHPLITHFLNEFPNYKKIKEHILNITQCKNGSSKKQKECEKFSKFLRDNIGGRKFYKYLKAKRLNCTFKQIIFCGKDGWVCSVSDNDNNSTQFGEMFTKLVKPIYFKNSKTFENKDEEKKEILDGNFVNEILEIFSSAYGAELSIKLLNTPNKLFYLLHSFQMIGFNIGTFPNMDNPDLLVLSLMYFDYEIRGDLCRLKNIEIPYESHLASGSIGDELYCFYSPNIYVGELFFEQGNVDLKTVKELILASSWVNNGYIPISKKVDFNGIHYMEAKQGNIIKDNCYAAIGSEYPILKKAKEKLEFFGSFILFSLFIIFFIAQIVISDLIAPVKRLIEGAVAASKGHYSFRTNFVRKDELGALCFSFDRMMKGLEEKQLMNRMVSKTALSVTSNLSDTNSKKVDVALIYVTVPGFDKIMKNTPPFELFSKLRKQIAVISEIVIENGGDIDKIMGEKLLIAFRVSDKKPEEVAINASKVASLIETCDNLPFKVSVGVNYGVVISGYLGVGEKRDFTIIGDPVNVAARIAVFGEKLDKDKCLVSETIFSYLDNNKAELLGEVELKGKSQPMKVYQLF